MPLEDLLGQVEHHTRSPPTSHTAPEASDRPPQAVHQLEDRREDQAAQEPGKKDEAPREASVLEELRIQAEAHRQRPTSLHDADAVRTRGAHNAQLRDCP